MVPLCVTSGTVLRSHCVGTASNVCCRYLSLHYTLTLARSAICIVGHKVDCCGPFSMALRPWRTLWGSTMTDDAWNSSMSTIMDKIRQCYFFMCCSFGAMLNICTSARANAPIQKKINKYLQTWFTYVWVGLQCDFKAWSRCNFIQQFRCDTNVNCTVWD